MIRRVPLPVLILPLTIAALALVHSGVASSEGSKPFGGKQDVAFAESLWKALDGYHDWPMQSGVYPGTSPHGKFLRLYSNVVNVDGEAYVAIVKDNFGGEGVSEQSVAESPDEYLGAVTVMVKREKGYDPENDDWYWVKYRADGSLDTNPEDMKLAGRVAKGSTRGCIACHTNAKGEDYVFTNDQH